MKTKAYTLLVAAVGLLVGGCSGQAASHGHEENEGGHEEVELTETQMKAVDIQLGELAAVSLGVTLKANGELAVNPQDEAVVAPQSAGLVKRIVVQEGQSVTKGQVVAYVENQEVVQLQQDYLVAKEEETLANQELERQQALADAGAGIRKNHQQAVANAQISATKVAMLTRQLALHGLSPAQVSHGKLLTEMPVVSPIAGTVTKITCLTGGYADVQSPLMKIVNNAAIYAKLNIFEKHMSDIAPGQNVDIRLTNRPTELLKGEVTALTQTMEPTTRSLTARVRILDGSSHDLVPGMAVTGIITSKSSEVEALPDDAIVMSEGRSYVFVLDGHGEKDGETTTHFKKMEVVAGIKERGYTQVKFLSPVEDAAKFVVKNAFYLGSMTSEHGEHNH